MDIIELLDEDGVMITYDDKDIPFIEEIREEWKLYLRQNYWKWKDGEL